MNVWAHRGRWEHFSTRNKPDLCVAASFTVPDVASALWFLTHSRKPAALDHSITLWPHEQQRTCCVQTPFPGNYGDMRHPNKGLEFRNLEFHCQHSGVWLHEGGSRWERFRKYTWEAFWTQILAPAHIGSVTLGKFLWVSFFWVSILYIFNLGFMIVPIAYKGEE